MEEIKRKLFKLRHARWEFDHVHEMLKDSYNLWLIGRQLNNLLRRCLTIRVIISLRLLRLHDTSAPPPYTASSFCSSVSCRP